MPFNFADRSIKFVRAKNTALDSDFTWAGSNEAPLRPVSNALETKGETGNMWKSRAKEWKFMVARLLSSALWSTTFMQIGSWRSHTRGNPVKMSPRVGNAMQISAGFRNFVTLLHSVGKRKQWNEFQGKIMRPHRFHLRWREVQQQKNSKGWQSMRYLYICDVSIHSTAQWNFC